MELICAECKNKWMPSNRINEVICPYCGNIIGELSRDFSSFEDGIAYIRNMFGDDIFEQRRFFFICTEYCLDYYEKEISAFKILYDSGLSKRILNLRGSDEKIIVRSKKQFVYQLRMKNGMNTSWAEYVIDLFCFATGISTENEFSSNILSKVRKAENGDPEAQYQVGICYKDGKGVERSLDDAIKWLSLSAGQKYTEAMVALYHIYAKENNKNIAKKYLEEAVNYGNVNAINTLAYCLYHGDDGYKQNIEKAVALLDSGVSQKSISMKSQTSLVASQVRLQHWAEQIKDCQNRPEDMDVKTWCDQNGLTKANYYYRVRKVREACLSVCEDAGVSFVELEQPSTSVTDVNTIETNSSAGAVIKGRNGLSIELYNTASQELIQKILGACAYAQ